MNKHLLLAAALAAICSAPAQAVTFEGSVSQGATVVTDYAGPSLVSFDIDFANFSSATLEFRIDDSDTLPVSFNAVLRNYIGSGLAGYTLTLDRGSFGSVGTVTTQFGGTALVNAVGGTATVNFSAPEFLDTELGNAYGSTAGALNWTLAGLQAGDRLNITVTALPVPEPGVWALMLGGLAGVGFMARRRQG
jgi:hypothetical protein